MKIESFKTFAGETVNFIKTSYNKGLKHFELIGYTVCLNKNYMQKDNQFVHYNKQLKSWIFDKIVTK